MVNDPRLSLEASESGAEVVRAGGPARAGGQGPSHARQPVESRRPEIASSVKRSNVPPGNVHVIIYHRTGHNHSVQIKSRWEGEKSGCNPNTVHEAVGLQAAALWVASEKETDSLKQHHAYSHRAYIDPTAHQPHGFHCRDYHIYFTFYVFDDLYIVPSIKHQLLVPHSAVIIEPINFSVTADNGPTS